MRKKLANIKREFEEKRARKEGRSERPDGKGSRKQPVQVSSDEEEEDEDDQSDEDDDDGESEGQASGGDDGGDSAAEGSDSSDEESESDDDYQSPPPTPKRWKRGVTNPQRAKMPVIEGDFEESPKSFFSRNGHEELLCAMWERKTCLYLPRKQGHRYKDKRDTATRKIAGALQCPGE